MKRTRVPMGLILLTLTVLISGCTLLTPKTQQLRGVIQYEDSAPVVGARVTLGTTTTQTDGKGFFTFANVARGRYTLTVSIADEEVHSQAVHVTGRTAPLTITIEAKPGFGTISGKVKRENGYPVADAVVTVGGRSASTDGQGHYVIPSLAYGEYTVVVDVNGDTYQQEIELDTPQLSDVDFTLPNLFAQVEGTVKDQFGSPISGAQVMIGDSVAVTDESGAFLLEQVAYHHYTVTVLLNGSELYSDDHKIAEPDVEIHLSLWRDAIRDGVTIDQRGIITVWHGDKPVLDLGVMVERMTGVGTARQQDAEINLTDGVFSGYLDPLQAVFMTQKLRLREDGAVEITYRFKTEKDMFSDGILIVSDLYHNVLGNTITIVDGGELTLPTPPGTDYERIYHNHSRGAVLNDLSITMIETARIWTHVFTPSDTKPHAYEMRFLMTGSNSAVSAGYEREWIVVLHFAE